MFTLGHEKPLLEFLRRGGSLRDPRGHQLVANFVSNALKDTKVRTIVDKHRFDGEDLCLLYAIMIESLMPNPCIESGGPMLAATLPFVEPHRLDTILSHMSHDLAEASGTLGRREVIVTHAAAHAQVIWDSHASARGLPNFLIVPDGVGGHTAPTGKGCCLFGFLLITSIPAGLVVLLFFWFI